MHEFSLEPVLEIKVRLHHNVLWLAIDTSSIDSDCLLGVGKSIVKASED